MILKRLERCCNLKPTHHVYTKLISNYLWISEKITITWKCTTRRSKHFTSTSKSSKLVHPSDYIFLFLQGEGFYFFLFFLKKSSFRAETAVIPATASHQILAIKELMNHTATNNTHASTHSCMHLVT